MTDGAGVGMCDKPQNTYSEYINLPTRTYKMKSTKIKKLCFCNG